ncbi:cupin-like domain-containing protein [Chitinophaga qingshengii]|uniref:Cupin-like domain-containing protein n=1 Tax=Chitinophaga qingshengii TaxID=1569794 RepID=A0ABR7TGL0_9BACT|nr:cupin-like domain-containing protein [Chitinophaga qingshengii]MBC9929603.1 cupin-like domain-containing protein [Chitinophaga qingshengii]
MIINNIDRVDDITPEEFRKNYYLPRKPVVISAAGLSKQWPAFTEWTWDYFKSIVGDKRVGVYNNERANANTLVNGADDYITFGEYIDMVRKGPVQLRIFLFNIFQHAPQLAQDIVWPDQLAKGFLKKYPMLFVGGAGSVAHMHYDIDMSHIFHTQFLGRKRVLLLENKQSPFIYRMPFTVESAASFVNWHEKLDEEHFPALRKAKGLTTVLNHGDTLFMPAGYWHHMEYMDSGFAMSLRALDASLAGKLNGLYHIVGLRGMNNILIKLAPQWWYHKKRELAKERADKALANLAI